MAKKKKLSSNSTHSEQANQIQPVLEPGESSKRPSSVRSDADIGLSVGLNECGEELFEAPAHLSMASRSVTRAELAILEESHKEFVAGVQAASNGTVTPTQAGSPAKVVAENDRQEKAGSLANDKEVNAPRKSGSDGKKDAGKDKPSWARVLTGYSARGASLSYVLPATVEGELRAQLQDEELKNASKPWENALIVYVVGNNPNLPAFRAFIVKSWTNIVIPEIMRHDDGFFVMKFADHGDMQKVIDAGPYFYNNRPIVMRPWSESYRFENDVLKTMPLWIRLPNLPLHYWSIDSLSRIGSLLGTPICADDCTTGQKRISFARMMVEMDISKPLPKFVTIEAHGQVRSQPVWYEWAPPFCTKCGVAGHNCEAQQKKGAPPKRIWRPKATQAQAPKPQEGQEVQADKGEVVKVSPPDQAAVVINQQLVAVEPGTPAVSYEAGEGWQTVRRSGKGPPVLTRFKGAGKRYVSPLTYSNAYLALIEEGDEEVIQQSPLEVASGSPYLT